MKKDIPKRKTPFLFFFEKAFKLAVVIFHFIGTSIKVLATANFECFIIFRGTYWANYATGLGASIHELGHCFDLAHTPKGIMGRGFDDMNSVFTMWKQPPPSGKDVAVIAGSGEAKMSL